jgi:hypothetical protein
MRKPEQALSEQTRGELARLYEERLEFAALFDHLAVRKRRSREVLVDRIEKEANLEDAGSSRSRRSAILEFFRRLEALGAGRLIVGRGGKKTRFRWEDAVSISEVAGVARGGSPDQGGLAEARVTLAPTARAERSRIEHRFALRTDFTVHLDLPADLTPAEADRLSTFVQALPFDRERKNQK